MKKNLIPIYFLLNLVFIYPGTNSEIEKSITTMGTNNNSLWEAGIVTKLDKTEVTTRKTKPDKYIYLKKVLDAKKEYNKETFILDKSKRISITTKSRLGASILLIDRMAGELTRSGIVNKSDGRIDIDLDAGEYQIIIENQLDDSVAIEVIGYAEINSNSEQAFFLNSEPGEYLSLDIEDLETRSFWIYAKKDEPVIFEALGRSLDSLTIWKGGDWKVDSNYYKSIKEVNSGNPLTFIEFNNKLDEGYYLFTLSGNIGREWSREGKQNSESLFVRTKPLSIKAGESKSIEITPFGEDAFIFTKSNTFIAAPQKKTNLELMYSEFYLGSSRYSYNDRYILDNKSTDDIGVLESYNLISKGNLIIKGVPGTTVKIGSFNSVTYDSVDIYNRLSEVKRYFINGFIPTNGENSPDLLPLLHNNGEEVIKSGFISIDKNNPLTREYNLDRGITYFLNIKKTDNYVLAELGDETNAKANYQIRNFKNFRESSIEIIPGESFRLNEGYYVISITPKKRGIHKFIFFTKPLTGFTKNIIQNYGENIFEKNDKKIFSNFNWDNITISHKKGSNYSLQFNNDNLKVLSILELPIELNDSTIPVVLDKNESVNLEIKIDKRSKLDINGENYTVKDSSGNSVSELNPGIHIINLTNNGNKKELYSVGVVETKTDIFISPPEIGSLTSTLPVLVPGESMFFDYDREEIRSFLLEVSVPSLYRLETTGRLRTEIKVRTANITNLFNVKENGIGRNGLINSYLKPGTYLVEVKTLGQSRGRASLKLTKNSIIAAPELTNNDIYRKLVPSGSALKFPVEIEEVGDYKFSTYLFNSSSVLRLEDSDGWPIYNNIKPTLSFEKRLKKGSYFYYTLPQNEDNRRVTVLNKKEDLDSTILPLNGHINGIWEESENREPKSYKFKLNAPNNIIIMVPEGFEGWIKDNKKVITHKLSEGYNSLDIDVGEYSFEFRTIEPNNNQKYYINIETTKLSVDNSMYARIPGEYTVSVGKDSVVDLWSYGTSEIEAYLYKDDLLIDYSSDTIGDWNFYISKFLKKGDYTLKIANTTGGNSHLYVKEREREETNYINLPFDSNIVLGTEVKVFSFKTDKTIKPLVLETNSTQDIFLTLYSGSNKIASGINNIYIPVGEKEYILELVQRSNKKSPVNINIYMPEVSYLDINKLDSVKTKAAILNNDLGINYYLSGKDLLYTAEVDTPMDVLSSLSISTVAGKGYLLSKSDIIGDVKSKELVLQDKIGQTVDLYNNFVGFKVNNNKGHITLIKSASPGLNLGLKLNNSSINWDQAWVSESKSFMILAPEGESVGHLWSGGNIKTKASLSSRSYSYDTEYIINKSSSVNIEPSASKLFKLNDSSYTVTISNGLVASLWESGKLIKTYYGDLSNEEFSFKSGNYLLAVINLNSKDGLIGFEKDKYTSELNFVTDKNDYEKYINKPGTETITINNSLGLVELAGNITSVKVYNDLGKFQYIENPGKALTINIKSGRIEVTHLGGLLKVWSADIGLRDITFASGNYDVKTTLLLDGANKLNENINIWDLVLDEPSLIQLNTNSGGITSLLRNNQLLEYAVGLYPEGRNLQFYLEKGRYKVISRALNGDKQNGNLLFSKLKPIPILEDQEIPEQFISNNQNHFYTFEVLKSGLIGVGVKSNKDYITAYIYNSNFELIKEGALNFMDLTPGNYYMVIKSDKTVRYKPIVLGLSGSVQEIPEDIIKEYR